MNVSKAQFRNANSAHLIAACAAGLLAGALSAQSIDERAGADKKKIFHHQQQDSAPATAGAGPATSGAIQDDAPDKKSYYYWKKQRQDDRAYATGQGSTAPPSSGMSAKAELSTQAIDGAIQLTLKSATKGRWMGGILASLSDSTVSIGSLPPLLGRSTVLAAGVFHPEMPCQQLNVYLRRNSFTGIDFFLQGVTVSADGIVATEVTKTRFDKK